MKSNEDTRYVATSVAMHVSYVIILILVHFCLNYFERSISNKRYHRGHVLIGLIVMDNEEF